MHLELWVEKYRPQKVADCILPDSIRGVAEGIVSSGNLPNLLMSGTAGTGKTTLALALCKEFGYDTLVINCSNDRGIDVLRTQITQFASSMSLNSSMKVVILDEFDHAGTLLQAALRNFMEEFHKTTRFILTCNYPQRIIEPLHSRCALIDFKIKSADKSAMAVQFMKRVSYILTTEGISFDRKVLAQVISEFFPDFRRTINELQRYTSVAGKIDESIVGVIEHAEVKDFALAIKNSDFKVAKKWIVESLAISDQNTIFRSIYDSLYDILDPGSIPAAILIIANYQHRGITAVDPEINMSAMAIELMSECTFI